MESTNNFSNSFLAPSRNGYGWGVFASRSFQQGDIVEVAPMFLRIDLEENRCKVLKETILNNYHYEYWAWDGIRCKQSQYSMISFGMTLYYNHQSMPSAANRTTAAVTPAKGVGPNIEQRKVGQEPEVDYPERAVAMIYFALRDIERGEELLVDYGGSEWFSERRMEEIVSSNTNGDILENRLTAQDLAHQQKQHDIMEQLSGKIYAGYHQQAFRRVMTFLDDDSSLYEYETSPFQLDTILSYLPNDRACFGSVTAMSRIGEGETIEYVPGLLLQSKLVRSTLLEPLAFSWDDFDCSPQVSMGTTHPKWVHVQYQDDTEEPTPLSSKLRIRREESVVFALAGRISMMARTCDSGLHNAVLQIEEDSYNEDGYCVRAVACKVVEPGEKIVLVVSQFNHTTEVIIQELCLTGQPFES